MKASGVSHTEIQDELSFEGFRTPNGVQPKLSAEPPALLLHSGLIFSGFDGRF
jgi:hypothetical protein